MSEGVLEVDRVSKRYGSMIALREMSFTVRSGEMFGFVGSNGAGKTTTMRIALGVLAADSGEVRLNGVPMDRHARRRIGYLPEERGLYPRMRVGAHLAYLGELHGMSRHAARGSAERWTSRLGLATRREDEVQNLSLGNQQRVQLAAALVHDPDVLVLDEPFAGLDPVAVDMLSTVLRERCAAGVGVVFSSHQLDLVQRLCDRVGIVANGELVTSGTVEELRDSGPARLVVHAPHANIGWSSGITGVRVLDVLGRRTVLELDADADDQAVLRAALRTGPVREFSRYRPTLTELFRDVVIDSSAAATDEQRSG